MTKLTLVFHADRSEIAAWIAEWVRDFELHVAIESFFPDYKVKLRDVTEIDERLRSLAHLG